MLEDQTKFAKLQRALDKAIAETGRAPLPLLRGFVLLGYNKARQKFTYRGTRRIIRKPYKRDPNNALRSAVAEAKRALVAKAVEEAGGNTAEAARRLGVAEGTLRYALRPPPPPDRTPREILPRQERKPPRGGRGRRMRLSRRLRGVPVAREQGRGTLRMRKGVLLPKEYIPAACAPQLSR